MSALDRFFSVFAVWDGVTKCSLFRTQWLVNHLLALTAHDKWQGMEWGCGCLWFRRLGSLWWLMAICITPALFWEAIKNLGKRKMESTLTALLEATLNFLAASMVLADHLIFILCGACHGFPFQKAEQQEKPTHADTLMKHLTKVCFWACLIWWGFFSCKRDLLH